MFALDHSNYSRWLTVHIRNMMLLSQKHLFVIKEFRAGIVMVHKTDNTFSAMAIDQCHEQKNAIIKGSGGAVGLTNNPPTRRRRTVAGPEGARMITEFVDDTTRSHQKGASTITMNSILVPESKQHLWTMSRSYYNTQWLKRWAAHF